jgi:phage terminase large subunit GpA-like protein
MNALTIATQQAIRYFADRPTQRPSQWCVENLRFDEPGNHGPFSVAGAEYCIEPLDDFADTSLSDVVDVWGSQLRKTGTIMGGAAWRAVNAPCNCLWVMPSIVLAQSFARKRWLTMLRASAGTRELLPGGAQRHDVKTLEQRVGASAFKLVGSNSPANLASEPCQLVIMDEVDKFDAGGREEADAVNLVEQRTKGQVNPQRRKMSTPTTVEGLIWQEAQKGDMRRYFVPAPCCGRHHPSSRQVVLAWSAAFSVLPKTGKEAFVVWDKEAKREHGWDLDRVERSARFQCPHCGSDILDAQKTWMNRNGTWAPTKSGTFRRCMAARLKRPSGRWPSSSCKRRTRCSACRASSTATLPSLTSRRTGSPNASSSSRRRSKLRQSGTH